MENVIYLTNYEDCQDHYYMDGGSWFEASYDPAENWQVSRKMVRDFLLMAEEKEGDSALEGVTYAMADDLALAGQFAADVAERVSLLGFTWEELEGWCANSYRLGSNPLPTLRKALEVPDIRFGFAGESGHSGWFDFDQPGMACWLWKSGEDITGVELEIYS